MVRHHVAPLLRDMSESGLRLRVSDSRVTPGSQLAAARWPVPPPAPDWTQIPNRARTDHSESSLEQDSPVNQCRRLNSLNSSITHLLT